jgi:hypothetical protein
MDIVIRNYHSSVRIDKERENGDEIEGKRIIYLFLLFALILVFSSCHPKRIFNPRHVSDIKPNMTKEEVASLWGGTPLTSDRTVNGRTIEIWEYHFSKSDTVCWVTFSQNRVVAIQCRFLEGGKYRYYSQPEPNLTEAPPAAIEFGP